MIFKVTLPILKFGIGGGGGPGIKAGAGGGIGAFGGHLVLLLSILGAGGKGIVSTSSTELAFVEANRIGGGRLGLLGPLSYKFWFG